MMNKIFFFLCLLILISPIIFAERRIHLGARELSTDVQSMKKESSNSAEKLFQGHIIIQFDYIPIEEDKIYLEKNGIQLLEYIPDYAWYASVSKRKLSQVKKMRGVVFVDTLNKADKAVNYVEARDESVREQTTQKLHGEFFSDVSRSERTTLLESYSLNYTTDGNYFTLQANNNDVISIINEDVIKWISNFFPIRQMLNSNSRALISVNTIHSDPFNLTGESIVIAEWDGGWAGNHSDLDGRVIIGDSETCGGGDTGTCGVIDHATHVAGTVIGNGSNISANKGMAPKATIISYEWFDDYTEFNTEYTTALGTHNASISTNSWGYTPSTINAENCKNLLGNYYTDNIWLDNATRGSLNTKITIVWAAGNQRGTSSTYCGSIGFTAYNTSPPQATAKNVITVGAVDDSGGMESYSSWGPTDDGRIKPDIVANGNSVTSTFPNNAYSSQSGTSMATPAVSGTIALIQEYYRQVNNNASMDPTLVKALLIQTADDLNETGPDFSTGYGLVNASRAINLVDANSNKSLFFFDNISFSGERINYSFDLPAGKDELKITLVWNDYPGSPAISKQLINDLDLIVENNSGTRFYPWTLNASSPGSPAVQSTSDDTNVVEQVYISSPSAGSWTVIVNGTTIPQPYQEFTLITSTFDEVSPQWSNNKSSTINPGYNDTVQFNITFTDGGTLSHYIFSWNDTGIWVNETTNTVSGKSANVSVNAQITAVTGSVIHWKFYINDTASNTNMSDEFELTVGNAVPQINELLINSTDTLNRTNGTLQGYFTLADADGDNITNTTRWYNGSLFITDFNDSTQVNASFTLKGQIWTFSVSASDGLNTTWVNTSITIANTLPNVTTFTSLSVNESDHLNFSITANDIDIDNLNYSINSSYFTVTEYNFSWLTNLSHAGNYSFNLTVNDSEGITSFVFYVDVINQIDSDGDGIPDFKDTDSDNDGIDDTSDFVLGNVSQINSTSNFTITINGSSNITQVFNATYTINISEHNQTLLYFNWSFNASNVLKLNNLTIQKQGVNATNGSLIIHGLILQNYTKTAYLDRIINHTTVCVKDIQLTSLNNFSSQCDSATESFLTCDGSSSNGYSCSLVDDSVRLKITGLNHSGIVVMCRDSDGDGYGTGCKLGADCNDADSSKTTDCSTPSSSSSSGGGGGGGGRIVLTNDENTLSQVYISMTKNNKYELKGKREKLAVTKLSFIMKETILKGSIVANVSTLPSSISSLENVYQYFAVTLQDQLTTSNIGSIKIEFRVPKSWAKNYDNIILNRYRISWQKYSATQIDSDADYYYYTASLPGFSYFAITGENEEQEIFVALDNATIEPTNDTGTIEEQPEDIVEEQSSFNWWWVIVPLLVLGALGLGYYVFMKKKEEEDEDEKIEELEKEEHS